MVKAKQGTAASDDADTIAPPPAQVGQSITPVETLARIAVVDAETGDRIEKVIQADADAGKVTRFVVEDGALVRDGNRYRTIEEERKIRIEWTDGENSF
ncbi:hypothetical protein [Sphingobium sp. Z007]|uniref:hypothetical protein n=1 Tax=Sphingobium sp. Z007 TaxID=627495 RepID=UPI000B497A16|nr:hypothetical protein [Sphingobium sp. Z007]